MRCTITVNISIGTVYICFTHFKFSSSAVSLKLGACMMSSIYLSKEED
jgi:hypothetical protein